MNRVMTVLALLAIPALAQQPTPQQMAKLAQQQDDSHKKGTYEFQYANSPMDVVNLVRAYFPYAGSLSYFPALNTVIIQASTPEDLPKILDMLKKYDVPNPDVELDAYLVLGSSSAQPARGGRPIPPESQSAISQMKMNLPDKSYSLRDVVETHSTSGVSIEGDVPDTGSYNYELSYDNIRVSRETKTVQIGRFRFGLKPCPQDRCKAIALTNSEVVLQEGQKLVFGKLPVNYVTAASQNEIRSGELYEILTVKIVDAAKK